jgi:hypothetical protein
MAYDVQTLKRGRLIGETTGGGAHHNSIPRGRRFRPLDSDRERGEPGHAYELGR